MIKGISLGETWEYVPLEERRSETPTVFILGTIDAETRAWIEDEGVTFEVTGAMGPSPSAEARPRPAYRAFLYLRLGLRGWRNLCDAQSREIRFEQDQFRGKVAATVASVSAIPPPLQLEIAEAVRNGNTLQETERKN
jgi:hypothetical protein